MPKLEPILRLPHIRNHSIIAFDLDGTLVNSEKQIQDSLDLTCRELLNLKISPTLVFENLGQPIDVIISGLSLDKAIVPELIAKFRRNLELHILAGNEIFPFATKVLESLRELGYRIAIATTKPTYLAEMVVRNSQLQGLIDFVQGTDGFPPKPNPEIFFRMEHQMKGKVVAMFGDRTEDVGAAKSAGIISIGIANGAHSVNDLLTSGANVAYESWEMLITSDFFSQFLKAPC